MYKNNSGTADDQITQKRKYCQLSQIDYFALISKGELGCCTRGSADRRLWRNFGT